MMCDSGASVNLVKIGALDWDLPIQEENSAKLGGITPDIACLPSAQYT